jgi:hypothetical protein
VTSCMPRACRRESKTICAKNSTIADDYGAADATSAQSSLARQNLL